VEKSGAVDVDDDPGAREEAPGVLDESGRDRGTGGKIPTSSARVGPMTSRRPHSRSQPPMRLSFACPPNGRQQSSRSLRQIEVACHA
jgi:hypothetical protein